MEDFDYGRLEIGHRLRVDRPICHEKQIIKKGIRLSLVCKAHILKGDMYWEIQIMYRDENGQSHCDCLPLDDYTVIIQYKGDMNIDI